MTAPPDCEPLWHDNPDQLNQLCEQGARQLHGHTAIRNRDTTTVPLKGDYL